MSSPIAEENKSRLQRLLVRSHQRASHQTRVDFLGALLTEAISSLEPAPTTAIDIGCGDMTIAEGISRSLGQIQFTCLDTYPLPERHAEDTRWQKYRHFDGQTLPFEDDSHDLAIFCDVLHHDFDNAHRLVSEALRVAKFVVIKDHFEYSPYSRQMLRLMDFVGNWGYGVSVPERYFSQDTYAEFLGSIDGASELQQICPIELYGHSRLLSTVLPGRWQFLSILGRS